MRKHRNDGTPQPEATGRRTARRSSVLVLLLFVSAGIASACVPPPAPIDPEPTTTTIEETPLRPGVSATATLGDGVIEVAWDRPADHDGTFDVAVRDRSQEWTTTAVTDGTRLDFGDVTNRERYDFQVRRSATPEVPAGQWGPVAQALYIEMELPVIRIDTSGIPIDSKSTYVRSTIGIDPNGSEFDAFSGTAGIRGRGNSTWAAEKKPYRIKLDAKSAVLGIPAERDWVLLANYYDRSHLRTDFAMAAGRIAEVPFTPTIRHVEVVLNGEYQGVYTLTQQTEVGADRVDIDEMRSTDNEGTALTGGYLIEIDERRDYLTPESSEADQRQVIDLVKGYPLVVKSPDLTVEQRAYIESHIRAFETTLFGDDFADPVDGYRRLLDVDSFIDHYVVQELTRNIDSFRLSTYFTKRRGDDRLYFGPLWDFDLSSGTFFYTPTSPEGWYANSSSPWVTRLFEDGELRRATADRWSALRDDFSDLIDTLEGKGADLRPAVLNDAERWAYGISYLDEPSYISDWLRSRVAWLDAEFEGWAEHGS